MVHRRSAQIVMRRNALWRGKDLFLRPDKNHPDLVVVTPRLTLSINWLSPGVLYDVFSRVNDQAVSMAVNETCRAFSIERYILVNSFNPLIGRFLNLSVKPLLNIYQSVDDISHSKYVNKHGPRLEVEAIRNSDFTIVTSSELKRLKSVFSENVFLLPNAANTTVFNTAVTMELEKPSELRDLPPEKKVICYTGNICHRLDYELLIKVARHHDDKILLMVGPFANHLYQTTGLSALPNVIFAGRKSPEDLPAYLKYSHCCIIPFLCNPLTRSIYPLKVNEYLSAGKPVVSTSFSVDMLAFREVATIAASHDEFVSAIDAAIREDNSDLLTRRVSFSSGNNWDARAQHFMDLTLRYLGENELRGRKPKHRTGVQTV